jgi:hypothetical protein
MKKACCDLQLSTCSACFRLAACNGTYFAFSNLFVRFLYSFLEEGNEKPCSRIRSAGAHPVIWFYQSLLATTKGANMAVHLA